MSKRLYALFALLIVALFVAACDGVASAEEPAAEEPAGGGEPSLADLEGEVVVDGSSTVGPLTAAVAEEFAAFAPKVEVPVGISGTGGGFKKFCPGETDISDASRPIKEEEADLCAENGVEYVEFTVALDGLAVMVSPENDFVDCLTVEQLGQIFVPDSTVRTWADVNPEWPAEDILLFAPDPDSGTRDYFIEAIIEPYVEDTLGMEGEEAEAMFDIRSDPALTFSTDDNVLLQGIAGEPCSALDPIATLRIEELMIKLKEDYSIIIVTHNMQQAARVSDMAAFMTVDQDRLEDRTGILIEYDETNTIFTNPSRQETEDYITGRFG